MFVRRRKLLVILCVVGIVWVMVTTFFTHGDRSQTNSKPNGDKVKSNGRQSEFYYDNADEQIELEAIKKWEKKHSKSSLNKRTTPRLRERFVEEQESVNLGDNIQGDLEEIQPPADEVRESEPDKQAPAITVRWHRKAETKPEDTKLKYHADKRAAQDWKPVREMALPSSENPPGHNGSAVIVNEEHLSNEERKLFDEGWTKHAHNEYVSRMISLRRVLPDVRDSECQAIKYIDQLPDVSVIITFHNEAWTTLLRTVHSVLDKSPSHLLREILLLDDASDEGHLKQQLEDYVGLLTKVRLVRTHERLGVIRARQQGAVFATGSVLVFLDSHCECTTGWLEPLLQRIVDNKYTIAIPVMDIIDDTTFQFKSFDAKSANIGGFDWNLQFVWTGISEREKNRRSSVIDPIQTPTMSGGMYAISRKWFHRLGGYDLGMDMWGAENLEMSFRAWMCGGIMEVVPCSHVGHVFRKRNVYQLPASDTTNPRKNFMRVAEVWMDDYKRHFYEKIGGEVNPADVYGDITERKALRKKLKCRTFEWYLNNVYPELFIPSNAIASGEIRNRVKTYADRQSHPACLDSIVGPNAYNNPVKIWPCHGQGGNQYWLLSAIGEIRRDDGCFDYAGTNVVIYPCHGQRGNQEWQYRTDGTIRHVGTKRCMELSPDGSEVVMALCNGSDGQVWIWKRNKVAAADDMPSENVAAAAGNDQAENVAVVKRKSVNNQQRVSNMVVRKSQINQEIADDDY